MKIYVGADHRGFDWKTRLMRSLGEISDVKAEDLGALKYNENDDYNDAAIAVAKAVAHEREARGILICGSGDGMCIQANRFRGVRAARCNTIGEVELAREHDDINVLCLAGDSLDEDLLAHLVTAFIKTEFSGWMANRVRRIKRLDKETNYD